MVLGATEGQGPVLGTGGQHCSTAMGMGLLPAAPALTWVWHSALGGQLGQEDAKGPDVRLDGKPAIQSSFRGCPLDGELGTWMERQGEGLP